MLHESGVEGVTGPPSSQTASKLRHLLDETADLIDSPSFSFVLTLLNNEGFSTLVDVKCANEAFKAPASGANTAPQSFDSIVTVVPPSASERKTKLANLLAVLARQAHVIGSGSQPSNEYLLAMDQNVRELEAFSAVIYSSNFDLELLRANTNAGSAAVGTGDPIDPDPSSSSPSAVMVDKETESSPTGDIAQTIRIPADQVYHTSVTGNANFEEEAEVTADSTFERAWGKAVEHGKDFTDTVDQAAP